MRQIIIRENDAGQRLDKFLAKALPALPKGLMCKFIRTKHIKRNGKRCAVSDRLEPGDVLSFFISDDFFNQNVPRQTPVFLHAPARLDVMYEDAQVLIVNKPAGLVVHTDDRGTGDTLVNRVLHYLYKTGAYDPAAEQSFTPALCNRLDRNTGGLVIGARTAAALREVNELIRSRRLVKQYLCITAAPPPKKQDRVQAYHRKPQAGNLVEIRDTPGGGFANIDTEYRVLAQQKELSLVLVTLHTGRTHQIRAHLAHLGAPLLGDNKYGNVQANRRYGVFTQQLWAWRLIFPALEVVLAPLSGRTISAPDVPFLSTYFPGVELPARSET